MHVNYQGTSRGIYINCSFNETVLYMTQSSVMNIQPGFNINPMEKWLEALEEIRRLNAELLKVKDEQIRISEKLIENK